MPSLPVRTLKTRMNARDPIGSALCVVNAVMVHYSKVQCLARVTSRTTLICSPS